MCDAFVTAHVTPRDVDIRFIGSVGTGLCRYSVIKIDDVSYVIDVRD